MRHLIACTVCERQYDVSGLPVGARMACACGASVEVGAARPHDAAVVRCSSCGGTREAGQRACTWCSSEFTLHEQDLHTICPRCATRVSDRARHCHACGVLVAPQPAAQAGAPQPCPVCAPRRLEHRTLPDAPPLLECTACLGFWIDPNALRHMLVRAAEGGEATKVVRRAGVSVSSAPPTPQPPARAAGGLYRKCPTCGEIMNRRRFPGGAAVIVDACREHGLWFDGQELERVLQGATQGLSAGLPGDDADGREARKKAARREIEAAWRAEDRSLGRDPWETSWADVALQALGWLLKRRR